VNFKSVSKGITALENINISIASGERVGLIGRNGAGKSTLLRAICQVYQPTSGISRVVGETASLIDIGLGINPESSGRDNIYMRGALLGLTKSQVHDKFEEIVEFSELEKFIDLPVRTYSSGMQMRLGFSVSMVIQPQILVMDEWLSVGDELFRHKAEKKLNQLVEQTEILVLASHSRELIENTCQRVIWLEGGQIRMDGPTNQVLRDYFLEKN
jgi:lipopolysaccharide transport system ATP-binding protein